MCKLIKIAPFIGALILSLTVVPPSSAAVQDVFDPVCELPDGRPTHQVPEPSSLILLGLGLSGLLVARKLKE